VEHRDAGHPLDHVALAGRQFAHMAGDGARHDVIVNVDLTSADANLRESGADHAGFVPRSYPRANGFHVEPGAHRFGVIVAACS
jgi:hypothetical protein